MRLPGSNDIRQCQELPKVAAYCQIGHPPTERARPQFPVPPTGSSPPHGSTQPRWPDSNPDQPRTRTNAPHVLACHAIAADSAPPGAFQAPCSSGQTAAIHAADPAASGPHSQQPSIRRQYPATPQAPSPEAELPDQASPHKQGWPRPRANHPDSPPQGAVVPSWAAWLYPSCRHAAQRV